MSTPHYEQYPDPNREVEADAGVGVGFWAAAVVVTFFTVAVIVWAGLFTSGFPTATVDEKNALESVQTPGEGGDAEANLASETANTVRVPSFAAWAPGTLIQSTSFYPQPGEAFTAQTCTVAFSFSNAEGKDFAVTAGHCGVEGNLVWPTTATTSQDYATEVGRFIYSGLHSPNAPDIDVGIIEITDPDRSMALVGAPIETGIAEKLAAPQDYICKTGGTTGYTCGNFREAGRIQITTDAGTNRETKGDIAEVCAAKGDSGGPVFRDVGGRATIIGVVSGTEAGRSEEECFEGMADPKLMSYSNVAQTMQVVNTVVPDAQWSLKAW